MKYIGKAIATAVVWGGVAGLSYLFNSFNILSAMGAGLMVFGAFVLTAALWGLRFD